MEHAACAVCGSEDTRKLFEARDRNWGIQGTFQVQQCRKCRLTYINPRPDIHEIAAYYPEELNFGVRFCDDLSSFTMFGTHWEKYIGRRVRPLLKRRSGGRLLDIGCGCGLLLHFMKSRGWDVYGVEPREEAVKLVREKFGIEVFHGYVEDADYPPRHFDVVNMTHVLEHVHDPAALVRHIRKLLAPGGLAMIEVPNFASLESRLFHERWVGLDVPRHLYHFTPETLEKLLAGNGFQVAAMLQGSALGRYTVGYMDSLKNLISDSGIMSFPSRYTVADAYKSQTAYEPSRSRLKSLVHAVEAVTFRPLGHIACLFNMGERITALAKAAPD